LEWNLPIRRNRIGHMFKRVFPVLLMLGIFAGAACTGGAPLRGWAGGVIDGDILYLGSRDGRLVGINVADGSRTWATPLETGTQSTGLGCSRAQIVVSIYGTPVLLDSLVYVAGYNGKVYSFEPGDAQPDRTVQTLRLGERNIAIGPVVGGIALYFGSNDGKVYALAADLQPAWIEPFQTGDKVWATPAVSGDTVYVGSFDRKFYALNAADGTKRWEFEAGGAFVAFDRRLYALDAATGQQRWEFQAGHGFWAQPVIVNGVIYAPSLDKKVYVLRADSGQVIAEIDLGSRISSSPVVVGQRSGRRRWLCVGHRHRYQSRARGCESRREGLRTAGRQ
jgi:outer membrane protein assembly factor BamB